MKTINFIIICTIIASSIALFVQLWDTIHSRSWVLGLGFWALCTVAMMIVYSAIFKRGLQK